MKIVILAKHYWDGLGGIEIQCDLIAKTLTSLGHQVLYLCPGIGNSKPEFVYELKTVDFKKSLCIKEILKNYQPDILYFRNNKYHLHRMAKLSHKLGIPVVFAASSLQDVQAWAYHKSNAAWTPRRIASVFRQVVKSRWNWRGLNFVSGAVSLNSDYTDRLPVGKKLHIPDSMEATTEPFHWPRTYVLWVAQLKEYKQPEKYVELAGKCEDLDVDFLMIGGLAHKQYHWIANHQGTPGNFHYLGSKKPSQVNGVLQGSLFLIHTCQPEGFGNNFIQAWQQGKPTLSLEFDPGGLIQQHQLGFVPGNLAGLEDKVRLLYANKKLRTSMGAAALQHSENYSPQVNIKRLLQFFEEIVLNHTADYP